MPESKRENDNEYQRIGRDDERLCLVNENSKWVVYYLERGVRTTELFFESEEEACEYIQKSLRE